MPLNRFNLLMKFLHVSNTAQENRFDKLTKIRKVM